MIQRTTNPKHKSWKNYGGKGVSICERWKDSFSNFLEGVGSRPEGMTLYRIDNNLGYTKENTRWADKYQQANNKRTSKLSKSDVDQIKALLKEGNTASIGRMFNTDLSVISAIKLDKRRAHC